MIRLTVLVENCVFKESLRAEHGFAAWVETPAGNVLFDTGQTDALIHNAKLLGIDVSTTKAIVLSHGHFDHTGGLLPAMESSPSAKVYLKRSALENKLSMRTCTLREIGIPGKESLIGFGSRVVFVEEDLELEGIGRLVADIPVDPEFPVHNRKLEVERGGAKIPDPFDDEQILALRDGAKIHVLTGCAHRSLPNIVNAAIRATGVSKIGSIVGGLHLIGMDEAHLDKLAGFMSGVDFENLYPCHCSGIAEKLYLRDKLGDRVKLISTGDNITL